jgi:protein ImuA
LKNLSQCLIAFRHFYLLHFQVFITVISSRPVVSSKENIISQLHREILSLQGFKTTRSLSDIDLGFGQITEAFPNEVFPLAAVHEFINVEEENEAATTGFIASIVSALMKNCGAAVWVGSSLTIFPAALKTFGISPEHIVFINAPTQREVLWATEEALKCEGLAAVIGEIREITFTESRRLQLAVEKSRVTGFIIRSRPRNLQVNACVSRWRISHLQSEPRDDLPGIGFPRWNIELLKMRNGRTGSWQVEWTKGKFENIPQMVLHTEGAKRKAS